VIWLPYGVIAARAGSQLFLSPAFFVGSFFCSCGGMEKSNPISQLKEIAARAGSRTPFAAEDIGVSKSVSQ
jgi:hypothetical protein